MSGSPAPGRNTPTGASALFGDPAAVDTAVGRLVERGVPRDLIDVVVSPQAARRHYAGRAAAADNEAFRYAGAGALIGLTAAAIVSLVLVGMPGFREPGGLSIVQLLGPNVMTIGGAAVGGLIGLFVRRRADPRHARAAEAPDSILVVVTARSEEELADIARELKSAGGAGVRLEA